jgi:hypothetical protein
MARHFGIACGALLSAALLAESAWAETPGVLSFEVRPRYESASQSGFADADALTLRMRLGWKTPQWRDLQGEIEFDDISALSGDYNDGAPPAEPFTTIADPEVTELNRILVAWAPSEAFTVTLGRQRITLDDQRFVGASGWRQDDQTFDALRLDVRQGQLQATYAYLDQINRVFGEALDWESQSHVFNVSYAFCAPLKLAAFAYLLDFRGAGVAQSNQSYGVRATGTANAGAVQFTYAASYAAQSEYGDNPISYDAEYRALDASATYGAFTARAGHESLEGNGPGQRFITPLATLHAFQGWADVFLVTPDDGVEDKFVSAVYRPETELPLLAKSALTLTWHDYKAERTGADLCEEFNAHFTGPITETLSYVVKYADYDGAGAPPDTTRAWIGLEFKL